jgi:methyl-accepting chemotaxis protein
MLFRRRDDKSIQELKERLRSLDENCLTSLNHGIAGLVGQISHHSSSVAGASELMAATTHEVGSAITEIANAAGNVASGAQHQVELVEAARRVSGEAVEQSQGARTVAERGIQLTAEIGSIADQTNLLP